MTNATNQNHPKNSGGFGTGFLVATVIFLVVLLLAGAIWGGWWYYKKYIKKSVQKIEEQAQPSTASVSSQNENLTYTNNDFGFSLTMTPVWKDYKTKVETMGGDFEVGRVAFFLPTAQKKGWESPDMPGYFNPFAISAYVKDSWDEAVRVGSASLPMGEEIGRNNYYVFVWSHFNGDPPSDIPAATIRDMQSIVDSIQTFAPASTGDSMGTSDSSGLSSASQSIAGSIAGRPVPEAGYTVNSVYYWNCKYGYSLRYPVAWSNNGMTKNSWQTYLYGSGVTVKIESLGMPASQTLQDFAKERTSLISGVKVSSEPINWSNNTTVIRTTFSHPDSLALHWISGSRGMEIMVFGDNYSGEYRNISNILGTLETNADIPECKTQSSPATPKDCSFPNGDIEFWWNTVSQSVRDCYISKYGYPSL